MVENVARAVAVVGVGAVLPDAPDAPAYWQNLKAGRYSISDVPGDRWDPDLYFDPDPRAPDKTYSKIGGWVNDWHWAPLEWRLPIPPKVADAMDRAQKWSIIACREALHDYGYPQRPLDNDRTAVVLGNAMAGDLHYLTSLRVYFPEYAEELTGAPSFAALDEEVRTAVLDELRRGLRDRMPEITEDTMPGELGNIIAGRVANLFDFHGPNFVVDAACASALAAIDSAIEGLEQGDYDAVLTGGVDANMGIPSFVKFCKIGALSATGTRPYHDGADGFVMGEGAAVFVLKRLADAERSGDRIYAVIRGIGGSSDGKGKGITAPNPVGQEFAVSRAWQNAGVAPTTATYIEGHGTSTRVGDVVEVDALSRVFGGLGLRPGSVPLGSVKSNIGHLKSAAGSAGMLKAIKALDEKAIPPSLGGTEPNPNIDFANSPLYINTELSEWKTEPGQVRSAGVSAFGFGGTNFHVVLEEYVPGRLDVADRPAATAAISVPTGTGDATDTALKTPLRGALVVGGDAVADVIAQLRTIEAAATAGEAPEPAPPAESALRSAHRVAIDYGNAAELAAKSGRAIAALESDNAAVWKALAAQGVFSGSGNPGLTAFLYTGQGSQYMNMLDTLRHTEPIVAETLAEADAVMEPILGKPLSDYMYCDPDDAASVAQAEEDLRQTEITQPAVLTVDIALTRLMAAYGIDPDMVMGHSLGEYGALVASGAMQFGDALRAVAGRGREMSKVSVDDNGLMAAVFAPIATIEAALDAVDGYVVIANINSTRQAVIGGATPAVTEAMERLVADGARVIPLPVSHAFHTEIVAPASEPLGRLLQRFRLESPAIPMVTNVNGEFYPMGPNVVPQMIDLLERQISSPVQFVKGLRTLYDAGCRTFVEMGPKQALAGMAADVLGDAPGVTTLHANHPKPGDVVSFNTALCGLYAAGLGVGDRPAAAPTSQPQPEPAAVTPPPPPEMAAARPVVPPPAGDDMYSRLGHLFADFLAQGYEIYTGMAPQPAPDAHAVRQQPVVITGAGLGLPGGERVFGDDKIPSILRGDQYIDTIPVKHRKLMVDKHITRLVKSEAGGGHFETIEGQADVIKLAGRAGTVDLVEEFGFPEERVAALEQTTILAIGAGIDALRDAGIPLLMHYKTTTTGTKLRERWMLPSAYRDTTGVIFAAAFPGLDGAVAELGRFWEAEARDRRLEDLRSLQARLDGVGDAPTALVEELRHRIHELEVEEAHDPYVFDRKFLFQALSMGHSQFAEYIGARGPNTHINAACASTTQAVALAEDWINAGRCERVVIISGDDVTSDHLLEWIGSGFLAVGAAATDEIVEEAALPFDRRRHGMILGMGAAALVVESAASAAARGIQPIAEVLSAVTANSAFHGSRLDPGHIKMVMEDLIATAERRWGISRTEIAPKTVFISHETYTPARGGSAQAEVDALRHVFGDVADRIVMSNTTGFTGHAMGVGVEDVVAVKSIETGLVPPVPNFREADPDLGELNLSRGGMYPVEYALRLGAGFGSQVSMTLYRVVPSPTRTHPEPDALGFEYRLVDEDRWSRWLADVSGLDEPKFEIVKRTLRIADDGQPGRTPVTSSQAADSGARRTPPAMAAPAPAAPPPEVTPPASVEPVAVASAAEPVAGVVAGDPTVSAGAVVEPVGDGVPDDVIARVLSIVAEQTGYPSDMLDLDLDLEADLGIDTVKQAETFAAIREAYGIARDDSLALRDYPTLEHVIGFVRDRRPDVSAGTATDTGAASREAPAEVMRGDDEAAAAIPRRIPVAVLRPDLDLCVSTGVTLDTTSRIVVMQDEGGVGAALVTRLHKLGADVLAIEDRPETADLLDRLDAFIAEGSVTGVYWLPALDVESPVAETDLAGWREVMRIRVKLLYATMRKLYDHIGEPDTFLISATRLGGRHGYDSDGAVAPAGGAVTGFTKAFKRERPEALVKAVDFAASRKTAALADMLIAETEADPGVVEVGRVGGRRWTIGLREQPLGTSGGAVELDADSTIVVTGAAGSIVSAITADLARAFGGTYHLLDLIPEPDRADPDIHAFVEDKESLKRTIFERLGATEPRVTPAMVEKELARIERSAAALAAIEAIEAAGGTPVYHSVDLRDADAVGAAMAQATGDSAVDLLLHAGGLEISRMLPDKDPDEFDLVFDVKVDGWFNLLRGLGDAGLGACVVFSSVAGRFGNGGQTDYSAANDLLCKSVSHFKTARPDTLGIAIDWTAWGDIGMATRGSIPTMMKAAGIDMLPALAGIPIVRREVTGRRKGGEQVVGLALGVLGEDFHPTGGLDLAAAASRAAPCVTLDEVSGFGLYTGLTVTGELDPTVQPFLHDHQIDGTPVLPGVMGVEAFAEAALLLFPSHHVAAIEDVDFLAPFKFYRNEPRTVKIVAEYDTDGDDIVAHCRLIGERLLANQEVPQETVHFVGNVRLSTDPPQLETAPLPDMPEQAATPAEIYEIYFHGPAYQVLAAAGGSGTIAWGRLAGDLGPNHLPEELHTATHPRLAELAFQTAGVWEIGTSGVMALPQSIRSVSYAGDVATASGAIVAVMTADESGGFDVRVADGAGTTFVDMRGYRTVPLPGALPEASVAPLRRAVGGG